VSNFSMWIGGKEMIGEVVEKKRAREIYESYKHTKRDPGLLEQVDFKRFEMRIFPILAGAEQKVRLTYYQELDFDHDWATYVYPLATTSHDSQADTSTGNFSFRMDVRSEVPIVEMKSPSHGDSVAISEFDQQLFRASLESDDENLNQDVVVAYKVKRAFTGVNVIANRANTDDGFLQLTLTVGEELEQQEKGMDYVFVLDVSGSMRNDSKLAVSGTSVGAFIENLSPEDRFELITFNDIPKAHFNSLMNADGESINRAKSELSSMRARGGTSLRPAIQAAYRYLDTDRPLNVGVLSDGMTEERESGQLLQLIQSRPAGTRVFAVGVGNEVNRPLLSDIARRSGGLAAFMSGGDDFERQAAAFRRKLLRPAIEDVQIRFDKNVHGVGPENPGSLYHGAPLRLYGRYTKGGTTNVTITGKIMGSPFTKTAAIELPEKTDANREIERMWAWHNVQELMGQIREHGSNADLENRIVDLCGQFSIVSQYASFIVLENDAEYRRWQIERRNLGRKTRDRAARELVQQELQRLRDKALADLGPTGPSKRKDLSPTATNQPQAQQSPQRNLVQRPSAPAPRPQSNRTGFDIMPRNGGGGGGALDPISGLFVLGLGASGFAARRRRKLKIVSE
ncbi:MAG: VIT domain-containing protein, partial [Planctomycetaceae bacterium]